MTEQKDIRELPRIELPRTEPPRWSRILSSWWMRTLFSILKVIPFVYLYWLIEYHDHPPHPDRGHGHPIYIHDTIYIDRVIYDTLFVIDDGNGSGHLSHTP